LGKSWRLSCSEQRPPSYRRADDVMHLTLNSLEMPALRRCKALGASSLFCASGNPDSPLPLLELSKGPINDFRSILWRIPTMKSPLPSSTAELSIYTPLLFFRDAPFSQIHAIHLVDRFRSSNLCSTVVGLWSEKQPPSRSGSVHGLPPSFPRRLTTKVFLHDGVALVPASDFLD
ncbi:hypothetical protein MCOR10_011418, partial [Pyricularia oryzae]